MRLFLENSFDGVTVAQVAEVADVLGQHCLQLLSDQGRDLFPLAALNQAVNQGLPGWQWLASRTRP